MFVVWFFYFKFAVDEISETTVDVIKSCLFLSTNKALALKLQHVEQLNFGVIFALGAEQEKKLQNLHVRPNEPVSRLFYKNVASIQFSLASVLRSNLLCSHLILGVSSSKHPASHFTLKLNRKAQMMARV